MTRVLVLVLLITARTAHGEACPPAATLSGDAAAVRAIRDLLDARGIADETPSCPALHARIDRRGAQLVVGITRPGGAQVDRTVSEPATAATVIESWVRSDVTAPLLETRAVSEPADAPAGARAPPAATTGIQLFAGAETTLASDRTVWEGLQLGACVMLGPICAAARVHAGKVIARPDGWNGFVRKGGELYAGIDIPIAVGRTRVTPGFAAGYGTMLTHHLGDGEKTGIEISGPRADVHVALSIPITAHVAIDLATAAELTQATGMETHGSAPSGTGAAIAYPDEPRVLVRCAIGVRYGAL